MGIAADIDPQRFAVHRATVGELTLAYVHEGVGGAGPLLLVHGWPETKRVWWRVIEPLVDAGFEVIAPDLRGFGDSDVSPDGLHDVASMSADLHGLLAHLGRGSACLVGGDLGGPVIQDMALRFGAAAYPKLVVFNCPLPYDREAMAGMDTRAPAEASDYYIRQGTDADRLAGELSTADARQRYIATFYTSRFWAHPGAFVDDGGRRFAVGPTLDFHTAPFADGAHLRAGFGVYESVFDPRRRAAAPLMARNPDVEVLILFGPSDRVIYPDFDRMAAVTFPRHAGPFLLRDCGHFVPWEAPQRLAGAVRMFAR